MSTESKGTCPRWAELKENLESRLAYLEQVGRNPENWDLTADDADEHAGRRVEVRKVLAMMRRLEQ